MDFGGDDIDKYIAGYFLEEFEKINPSIENRTEEEQAVIISRILSHAEKHKISFNEKILKCSNPKRIKRTKEGVNFEIIDNLKVTDLALTDEILRKILCVVLSGHGQLLSPINKCLNQAGLSKNDIDLVILTGGSSKFYLVEETINKFFSSSHETNIELIQFTKNNAVSIGAAIYSHTQDEEEFNKITISDAMSDSILIKNGSRYDVLISHNTSPGTTGTYSYKFEKLSNRIDLFLYYGLETEKEYKYKEIAGVFHTLERWYEKGEQVNLEWEFDDNKVVHIFFEGSELLSTNNLNQLQSNLINDFKINAV